MLKKTKKKNKKNEKEEKRKEEEEEGQEHKLMIDWGTSYQISHKVVFVLNDDSSLRWPQLRKVIKH